MLRNVHQEGIMSAMGPALLGNGVTGTESSFRSCLFWSFDIQLAHKGLLVL